MSNQKERVLAYVRTKGSITPREARETYSIERLAAVIFDLKQLGHVFDTLILRSKNKFGEPCTYARYMYKGMVRVRTNQQNHDLVANWIVEDK